MNSRSIHGNSAGNQKAYLYRMEDLDGNILKWGITQHADVTKRYTNKFLRGKEMFMIESGPRSQMIIKERALTEMLPGPLNNEPWAGAFW